MNYKLEPLIEKLFKAPMIKRVPEPLFYQIIPYNLRTTKNL